MLIASKIRNFCIIAHIDHGKSTLADRFLEVTNTLSAREMKHGQMLDMMDIEQERGITIKLQPVRMEWVYKGETYILNLIDTPGHVDFTYEVSRSLAACEGAILVIDATQGIQAQTLANCYLALEHNLSIIPVLNKIDLAAADTERCLLELENTLGIDRAEVLMISAKTGKNVPELLGRVIEKVPPPKLAEMPREAQALIFDSVYDLYKGIVAYVRVVDGGYKCGDRVTFLNTKAETEVLEVGYFRPRYQIADSLKPGEVGYIVTGVKNVREARVGDTIWHSIENAVELKDAKPLPGYKKVMPVVFASVFPVNGEDYPLLRDALDKLSLNDSALVFEPESSGALGHGFRCGFLGLLHLDIVQERLEREYNLQLIVTAPSVSYQLVLMKDKEEVMISNPSALPDPQKILELREPWVKLEIFSPKEHIGAIMQLVQEKRGLSKGLEYLDPQKVLLNFELPLASMVIDFYDKLKSITAGYASMNYTFIGFRADDLVKLDILIAGDLVPALSSIVHRSEAYYVGASLTKRLKKLIPRNMFEIAIQAGIGAKMIARETIPAMRKDVIAKLYGGDRTRKDKLLKKQKAGKKRMKMFGKVEVPQEAFLAVLKRE